ncbi:MAG: ergothioneine biosynthesis protein EgtB [Halioglobus sp.]
MNASEQSITETQKALLARYSEVRNHSVRLCEPLATEDYVVQPVSDVSPPKWHLAHTTWFFEELLLTTQSPAYERFNNGFATLFNSYYKAAGEHWLQSERGQLSRPTVAEVMAYREHVDSALITLLNTQALPSNALSHLEIGLHHEQQHQELLLMDIKYILGANPFAPVYATDKPQQIHTGTDQPEKSNWHTVPQGLTEIGHCGQEFGFDNESPRHTTYLQGAEICSSLVSNGQFLEFIQAGGYQRPEFWLSMGWEWLNENTVNHPLYWVHDTDNDTWEEFTLYGKNALEHDAPVSHVSYFEAQAFAAWAQARLPTEQELEQFLGQHAHTETVSDKGRMHPWDCNASADQLWCWTSSAYAPYPGFKAYEGMLEEYNGKFMCNQYVLRGGCVATPPGHYRPSYRNFYLPHQRWMFSGIRLAKDIQ